MKPLPAEKLVDVEDNFRRRRFNHVTTVERMIGHKIGCGGTTGVDYLRKVLDVVLFPELWQVRAELLRCRQHEAPLCAGSTERKGGISTLVMSLRQKVGAHSSTRPTRRLSIGEFLKIKYRPSNCPIVVRWNLDKFRNAVVVARGQ